ncbi:hypothetical protein [Staphylococcus chromogenes]
MKDASGVFKISSDSLNNEVEKVLPKSSQYSSFVQPTQKQSVRLNKNEVAESAVLKHLINDKDVFLSFFKKIEKSDFTN